MCPLEHSLKEPHGSFPWRFAEFRANTFFFSYMRIYRECGVRRSSTKDFTMKEKVA